MDQTAISFVNKKQQSSLLSKRRINRGNGIGYAFVYSSFDRSKRNE